MENTELIIDKGLFLGKNDFNFSLPDSFETILNFQKTIKEYREYAHPENPEWMDYIHEFFHVLGFQTEQKAPRLITLSDMGANGKPKVMVLLIKPGESLDEIISGLDWISYLFFAASHFHVQWGLLTNGLEIKVIDIQHGDYADTYFWANIDGIVLADRLESFFTIYKVFCFMRGFTKEPAQGNPNQKMTKHRNKAASMLSIDHLTKDIPQTTLDLFYSIRNKILSLSPTVQEKFQKQILAYAEKKNFCEIWIQKSKVRIYVDIPFQEVNDPQRLCRDLKGIGHWGSGETEVNLQKMSELDMVFEIIKQGYDKNR